MLFSKVSKRIGLFYSNKHTIMRFDMIKMLRFGVVIVLTFCLFAKAEEDNPFFKLISVLEEMHDSTNSFADINEKLSKIKPAACEVDEISLTKSEVEFMINFFRLDFAVTLKQGELSRSIRNRPDWRSTEKPVP